VSWIKFHGELRKGSKRGLSRASRFVYLELAHEARPGRGVIELARGLEDVDAVHDILGGNRKEVATALQDLASEAFSMVCFEGEPGARRLVVTAWDKWNSVDETAARRMREHRARQKPNVDVSHETVTRNGPGESRVTPEDVTRLDQRREDKRDLPSGALRAREGRAPDFLDPRLVLDPEWSAYAEMIPITEIPDEFAKFKAHHLAHGHMAVDWFEAWKKWLVDAKKIQARERGRASGSPPKAEPQPNYQPLKAPKRTA
jgi:hypothetical protein